MNLGDSLDLVVIGAFFGKGRRTGKYGTLLLALHMIMTRTYLQAFAKLELDLQMKIWISSIKFYQTK